MLGIALFCVFLHVVQTWVGLVELGRWATLEDVGRCPTEVWTSLHCCGGPYGAWEHGYEVPLPFEHRHTFGGSIWALYILLSQTMDPWRKMAYTYIKMCMCVGVGWSWLLHSMTRFFLHPLFGSMASFFARLWTKNVSIHFFNSWSFMCPNFFLFFQYFCIVDASMMEKDYAWKHGVLFVRNGKACFCLLLV